MSTAAAAANAAPPKKGKKTLIVVLAAVVVLLAAAGGGVVWWMGQKAAALDEDDEAAAPVHTVAAPKVAPTFVPLELFTVNLADRDVDRYAQIGITLEVTDGKVADQIKTFMPVIRNNILMVLAHKTSDELLQREGKERLAAEIRRETLLPLGIEIDLDEAEDDDARPRSRKRRAPRVLPVTQVHFSSFIIQ